MREPFTHLYVHLVWATWDRLPLIQPAVEKRLYGAMIKKCREFKCIPIRVGGVEDHTHLLVRLHPTTAVAKLVQEVKVFIIALDDARNHAWRIFQMAGRLWRVHSAP